MNSLQADQARRPMAGYLEPIWCTNSEAKPALLVTRFDYAVSFFTGSVPMTGCT